MHKTKHNRHKTKKLIKRRKKQFRSPLKRKFLLLLQAGFAMSLTPSPKAHGYILRELGREWEKVDCGYLKRIIQEFRYEKLINWDQKTNGTIKLTLTKKGQEYALEYKIDEMKIKKPQVWDSKWRIVIFDIPERKRKSRNALRNKLKELDFQELQKSVFIQPYPCQNEIDFIVEFFNIRPYVRYAELTNLTNEEELKLCFNLT